MNQMAWELRKNRRGGLRNERQLIHPSCPCLSGKVLLRPVSTPLSSMDHRKDRSSAANQKGLPDTTASPEHIPRDATSYPQKPTALMASIQRDLDPYLRRQTSRYRNKKNE